MEHQLLQVCYRRLASCILLVYIESQISFNCRQQFHPSQRIETQVIANSAIIIQLFNWDATHFTEYSSRVANLNCGRGRFHCGWSLLLAVLC